ncbi:MAG: rubrerythrin [Selenomonadaceae bacterium]
MAFRKVEKISRVTPVAYDIGRQYTERRGGAGLADGEAFQHQLDSAMKKKRKMRRTTETEEPRGMTVSAPYEVDVTRATQSLFYQDASLLSKLRLIE